MILNDYIEVALFASVIEYLDDTRNIEVEQRFDLRLETLGKICLTGDTRIKDFDHHFQMNHGVRRLIRRVQRVGTHQFLNDVGRFTVIIAKCLADKRFRI